MKPLEVLNIEKPCTASWAAMKGDEKVRHCAECHLDVYNLSAMTRDEAERVVSENEGHLCVRVWKRADGTVITHDCAPYRGDAKPCVPSAPPSPQHESTERAAARRRVAPPILKMGKIAAPTFAAELEPADAALGHDTLLAELGRAVQASFDTERGEELLRAVELALGPRSIGTARIAPEAGRNAGCESCEGPLWVPPMPAPGSIDPVNDRVETRQALLAELSPGVTESFGAERATRLLREILRVGFGTGVPHSRAPCPHCAIRLLTPE